MDVEGRELPSAGGELDEETIAKKRSRRVSFAETTAVHVFDRDEDFETPPESRPPAEGDAGCPDSGKGAAAGCGEDHSDSDDSRGSVREEEDDGDDEEEGEQEKFVRDMDSSSPGSAVGSVTSNDDDNFFGPVSTSFIRSGRLSEAGMSDDDNHDITLDSTAFSLHYRNIGPADDPSVNSAGSLRTPTGDTVPAATADLMAQKESRKLFSKSKLSDGKPSISGGESSSMSLIVDKPGRYDYGKLSPTLEALLDQVNKSIESNSPNTASKIETSDQHASEVADVKKSGRNEKHTDHLAAVDDGALSLDSGGSVVNSDPDTSEVTYTKESGKHERDTGNAAVLENGASNPCFDSLLLKSSSISSATNHIGSNNHSPIIKASLQMDASVNEITQDMISPMGEAHSKDVHETSQSDMVVSSPQNSCMLSPALRGSNNSFIMQSGNLHQTLFKDQFSGSKFYSTSSPQSVDPALVITHGQHQLLESERGMHTPKNAVPLFQSALQESVSSLRAKRQQLFLDSAILPHSSAREEPPSFFDMEIIRHGERMSAIKNHISKSKVLETPGLSNSKLSMSGKDRILPEHQGSLEKRAHDPNLNKGQLPMINTEQNLTNSMQKNRAPVNNVESMHAGVGTLNARQLASTDENEVIGGTVKLTEVISSCDFPNSEMNMKQSPLASRILIETVSVADVHGSSQKQTMVKLKESSQVSDDLCKDNRLDLHSVQESIPTQDFDSVGKRRRIGQNLIMEDDHVGKTGRPQKSPKISSMLAVNRSGISPGHHVECGSGARDISDKLPEKRWTEIVTKLSEATKLIFSPSIRELRLKELDSLEDVLDQLQMSRKYERLLTSLKNHDCLVDLRQQRVAGIRSLQDKLLYERAKLELKQAKLDLLRNRARLNQSGRQDCDNLRAMFSQLGLLNKGAARTVESHRLSVSSLSSSKSQDENRRVISMRQELKMLEQKVDHLIRSLKTTCKIKGNLNCDGIIKAASEYVEKRTFCRIENQNLQLWKLCDIVTRSDQRDIVLNYCDLLFQRFTINTGRVSNIVASNTLNLANVEKRFPNMNATMAFEFVFKAKGDDRLAISKFLQQKTLETSLLLGTLIDVLHEVHVAGLEMLNLISSTFDSQPCQLELHICFMNFRSGWKVTLSLDMTDLNCGVYPSELSELHLKVLGAQTTLPPSVTDATLAVIQNLQGGRLMILRLCRSISQVVQASSR